MTYVRTLWSTCACKSRAFHRCYCCPPCVVLHPLPSGAHAPMHPPPMPSEHTTRFGPTKNIRVSECMLTQWSACAGYSLPSYRLVNTRCRSPPFSYFRPVLRGGRVYLFARRPGVAEHALSSAVRPVPRMSVPGNYKGTIVRTACGEGTVFRSRTTSQHALQPPFYCRLRETPPSIYDPPKMGASPANVLVVH